MHSTPERAGVRHASVLTAPLQTMIWADLGQLVGAVLLIVGALLPIVNPLGDAPVFLSLTPDCDDAMRATLAKRVALYSFALLLGSMLLGTFVLRLFGLSIPIVEVAGGLVLCALGWRFLADNPRGTSAATAAAPAPADAARAGPAAMGRAFYPLTMPLSVDAGAIAVAIAVGANRAHTVRRAVIQVSAAAIGAGILALSILVTYRYAEGIGRRIGPTGMMVLLRLSAFIMLCIGVGIVWNGVRLLLAAVGMGR